MLTESTSARSDAPINELAGKRATVDQVIPAVDALVRLSSEEAGGRFVTSTLEIPLEVVRHASLGSPVEWVFLGNEDHHIELSLESARELVRVLSEVVAPD
jgi:hypothetical protein